MSEDTNDLLARVGTALYDNDALTRRDLDALYDAVDALVAEVKHLREENAVLMRTSADPCLACGWRFFVPGEGCQGCLVEQLRKDNKRYLAEERAAVVAYLREYACGGPADEDTLILRLPYAVTVELLAYDIERGEHRREEGP